MLDQDGIRITKLRLARNSHLAVICDFETFGQATMSDSAKLLRQLKIKSGVAKR